MALKIRTEQFEALAAPHAVAFIDRLTAHLREEFPEAVDEPEEELRNTIRSLVDKADSYDLTSASQAAVFVTCAWLLGADFDAEFPAAQQMLASPDYTPAEKEEWLIEWAEALFAALEQN